MSSDRSPIEENARPLGDLNRRNRPNQRRVSPLSARQHGSESPQSVASHESTAPPASNRSAADLTEQDAPNSSHPTIHQEGDATPESQGTIENRQLNSETRLFREQLAQFQAQVLGIQDMIIEMNQTALEIHNQILGESLSTHEPNDSAWLSRKAAIEQLLVHVDTPWERIDPCFCTDGYSDTTDNGDCHAPAKLPVCGHVFGRSCIANWLQDSNTCPMCRNRIVLAQSNSN